MWGYGTDDAHLIAAVRVVDVTTGAELDWFPGPRGALVFDRELASLDGLTLWDVARGARLARDPAQLARYHRGAKIYTGLPAGRRAQDLPGSRHRRGCIVVDADDPRVRPAGCPGADMIAHCHAPGEHGARGWVLDRLVEP